jgi:hypothetical protein
MLAVISILLPRCFSKRRDWVAAQVLQMIVPWDDNGTTGILMIFSPGFVIAVQAGTRRDLRAGAKMHPLARK